MSKKGTGANKKHMRPAMTPEAREKQLIAAAMDLAEEKILNGTASSQIIVHFLNAGSEKQRLERERLETENEKLKAQIKQIQSTEKIEELYTNAIKAMMTYSGNKGNHDDYEDL